MDDPRDELGFVKSRKMEKCSDNFFAENEKLIKSSLAALLNKLNIDTACDTPDFILANMIFHNIRSYQIATKASNTWHGRRADAERTITEVEDAAGVQDA